MLQEPGREREVRVHPTQKPVALQAWCLSRAGHTVRRVLDPFAGSGSTLRACKDAGIECVGVERRRDYCEMMIERLRQGVFDFGGPEARLLFEIEREF
jgi:DNA modification methylase